MAAEASATIVSRPPIRFEVPASRRFSPRPRVQYDAATVALRVLRLIAVASIFAFVLTARTVMPTHANTEYPAADPSPADVELSPADLGEEPPPPEPPPPEPPPVEGEPPPADTAEPTPTDPPPADTVEPAPTDPPPADTVDTVEPTPTDPPPADTAEAVEPAPTDPPPADTQEVVVPPTDPPVATDPPPADVVEPAPIDPPESDSTVPPDPDAATIIADPADSDPSAAEPAPPVPSSHRSPKPVADDPAQTATTRVTAIVSRRAKPKDGESDVSPNGMALHSAVAAGAGLAAGLVVTNHAPSSVAVAVEFGRVGGGWASAIVFNLWLRRQMRERRMSQRQLAALAGIDHSTISRLLAHDRAPSLTTATKLAGALRQVQGEQAEPATADYFERNAEETVFPARRVELALRADELLDDEQVRHLMDIYLDARRRHQVIGTNSSAPTRAGPKRAAADPRR
jgi:transcriptional regulator with XRE-family HTH domain